MAADRNYTTQFQAGLGMVQETIALLRLWEPGTSPSALADRVIAEGLFARNTARRARNLAAEMFAPRYLKNNGEPALRLRRLLDGHLVHETLVQLFFLQTARAQQILADFVRDVYWPKYGAGSNAVTKADAETFIQRALDEGRMSKRWSESTIHGVSGYLVGCCADFGLLEGGVSSRTIRRFYIRPEATLYLTYDLHFSGFSDRDVVTHVDWQLFGLEASEVLRLISNLSHDRHLEVQSGADLIQISWKYRTMEECIDVLSKR